MKKLTINPITKILIVFLLSISSIFSTKINFFLVLILFIILSLFLLKINIRKFFKNLKPIFFIFLFTLIINILFNKNKTLIFEFYFIKIYLETLKNGLLVFLRFFSLISLTSIIIMTTPPIELTHGLEDFLSPLKKLKIPVSDFTLILSIALNFIPIFFEEAERIKNAQASKGFDFEDLNYKNKLKFYSNMIVPLISSAITRAEILADAMEIKGYSLEVKKTRFREYFFTKLDFILLFLTLGIIIILVK